MMEATTPLLLSALMLGFFGSVHCLVMCGGIAGALGQRSTKNSGVAQLRGWLIAVLYSTGRISSYAIAGALAGLLGEAFATQTGLGIVLRCLAGLLIIAFGLHVAGIWSGVAWIERAGLLLWNRISPLVGRVGRPDRPWKVVALGMVWGWLPCGLVYSALAGAAAGGGAALGAAFMACFGLGTLPALVSAGALSAQLAHFLSARPSRALAGAVLLCFGLWSIAGALLPHMGEEGESHSGAHATHLNHVVPAVRSGLERANLN